jgi:tetratricopeptide (TPR) repeat protein
MRSIVLLALTLVAFCGAGCGPSLQQYRQQGVADLQMGRFETAEESFGQVLAQRPSDPFSLYYMGVIKQRQGDYVQAMYYYQSAIDADPTMTAAKVGLAKSLQQAGSAGPHLTFIPSRVAQAPTRPGK